jgi:hypothetical protein
MTCTIEGCERKQHARGWCGTHYHRWRRLGTVELTPYITPHCSVDTCESPSYSTGMCTLHYQRVRSHGTTDLPTVPFEERFWGSVRKAGEHECWLWTRPAAGNGYGVISRFNRHDYAHRLAYELTRGPITDDLTVDHLCRVRLCVNPIHLELVTRAENTRRELAARKAAS